MLVRVGLKNQRQRFDSSHPHKMSGWPSGQATVCKTVIRVTPYAGSNPVPDSKLWSIPPVRKWKRGTALFPTRVKCPCGVMDSIPDYGSVGEGSNPFRDTKYALLV